MITWPLGSKQFYNAKLKAELEVCVEVGREVMTALAEVMGEG